MLVHRNSESTVPGRQGLPSPDIKGRRQVQNRLASLIREEDASGLRQKEKRRPIGPQTRRGQRARHLPRVPQVGKKQSDQTQPLARCVVSHGSRDVAADHEGPVRRILDLCSAAEVDVALRSHPVIVELGPHKVLGRAHLAAVHDIPGTRCQKPLGPGVLVRIIFCIGIEVIGVILAGQKTGLQPGSVKADHMDGKPDLLPEPVQNIRPEARREPRGRDQLNQRTEISHPEVAQFKMRHQ